MSDELDFKSLFEKDFDDAGISVSDDLIARTMAAIKDIEKEPAEPVPVPVQAGTSSGRKKTWIRMFAGLAAAIAICVVGVMLYKNGGLIKKSEDKKMSAASEKAASDTVKSSGSEESETGAAQTNTVKEYSLPAESADTADADEDTAPEAPSNSIPEAENADEAKTDNSMQFIANEKQSSFLKAEEKDGLIERVTGEKETDSPEESPIYFEPEDEAFTGFDGTGSGSYSGPGTLNNGIANIITSYYNDAKKYAAPSDDPLDYDREKIRSMPDYLKLKELGNSIENELYLSIKESSEDGPAEFIEALLLEDISGRSAVTDTADGAGWNSGKEYLKVYEGGNDPS